MILKILLGVHIASGCIAILSGAIAFAPCKGGALHARAGSWFVAAMLTLGVSAAILEPFRDQPGSPMNGVFVCYFVLTGWFAARRHDGRSGRFEMLACAIALCVAGATLWAGLTGATTPAGRAPIFVFAALCLLAGLGDLNVVLRKTLSPVQRISRHLWRMCFAFFIATGSFFLGQQDVMPAAVRGSPILFVLAFAPFALMAFWLVRVRFGKRLRARFEALGRERRGPGETLAIEPAE